MANFARIQTGFGPSVFQPGSSVQFNLNNNSSTASLLSNQLNFQYNKPTAPYFLSREEQINYNQLMMMMIRNQQQLNRNQFSFGQSIRPNKKGILVNKYGEFSKNKINWPPKRVRFNELVNYISS